MSTIPPKRFDFDRAQLADLPALSTLAAGSMLGADRAVPLDVKAAWMHKNPDVLHVLRWGDEIVGYICMLPLSKATVMQSLHGKITARAIPLDAIELFTPALSGILLVVEAVVNQDLANRARVAARLISDTARFVICLIQQNMLIEELYAVAVTPSGIRVCSALGFQELPLPGPADAGRIPFQLQVQAGGSPAVTRWALHARMPSPRSAIRLL